MQDADRLFRILEMGKVSNTKERIKENFEKAVEAIIKYRPSESKKFGKKEELNKMYEIIGTISTIKLEYSHYSLGGIFVIYEAFRTDKISRVFLDIEYVHKIEKKASLSAKEKFVKKHRQVVFGSALKKLVLTKKLLQRILQ